METYLQKTTILIIFDLKESKYFSTDLPQQIITHWTSDINLANQYNSSYSVKYDMKLFKESFNNKLIEIKEIIHTELNNIKD